MKLRIRNLQKFYGEKEALHDFSILLKPGIYGILGSNGAGKTTLMNLLTDNIRRSGGEILWRKKDILERKTEFRRRIGYMPQQQKMQEGFTVEGFLHYMAELKEVPQDVAKEQITELLAKVNLSEKRKSRIGSLSGGMKQRVLLVQALLGDPGLVILDEPTAGLDPQERIRIRNLVAEVSKDKIILLATHVVSDVECIADQILLMREGQKVAYGTPQELIASLHGHVAEIPCTKEDVLRLQQEYPSGNLLQRKNGLCFRIVGDEFPPESTLVEEDIGLEEVYLYYLEYLWEIG